MGHPARRRPSPPRASAPRPARLAPVPTPTHFVIEDQPATIDDPLDPGFLDELGRIGVVAAGPDARRTSHPLDRTRAYRADDLMAVAEVAYVYLFGGHESLALVLFDGLAAVSPREAYFELARGLAHDLLGDLDAAVQAYARAAKLDPTDPRPDVNRAEIHLERKDLKTAHALLARAGSKADADDELTEKIDALQQRVRQLATRS